MDVGVCAYADKSLNRIIEKEPLKIHYGLIHLEPYLFGEELAVSFSLPKVGRKSFPKPVK